MKKHANLSIFVPHVGCRFRCSFCDQREISGSVELPTARSVTQLCERYLPEDGQAEIAFFGGSFTAIERGYMCELLGAAKPFVDCGRAAGIRLSTRPDAVGDEVLSLLSEYGVTAVELGAQSMTDAVLEMNGRGHTAQDVRDAAARVKRHGFSLGLQMMSGLYGENDAHESALYTAREIAACKPETVRIYPALVVENTELARLYRAGEYQPQALEQAVQTVAELLLFFERQGITVIRVGLHSEMSLQRSLVAGPFHPAFGELCRARAYRQQLENLLSARERGTYTVCVASGAGSQLRGQHAENINYFAERGFELGVKENAGLSGLQITLVEE